jgi:4-hydroxybenzoate polyprenyltransferase
VGQDWPRRWFVTFVTLVRSCHPEPTLAVTACLTALAATTGRDVAGIAVVALAVLAGQLSIGWSNDWIDAERDARAGRRDKPVAAGQIGARTTAVAAGLAAAASVPLSLLSGWVAGVLNLIGVGSGWAYNAWFKSSRLSVLPYAVAFACAPAFVVVGLPGTPAPPVWLLLTGALIGSGAHFANVIPDLDDDAATGIRGLPHRLGATGSAIAAATLLGAASVVLALGPPGPPGPAGIAALVVVAVVLGAGLWRGRRPGSRAPFRAVLLVAVIDVALLLLSGASLG